MQAVARQTGAPSQTLQGDSGREESAGESEVYEKVKDYYGKQVTKQSELQTSACLLPVGEGRPLG